MESEEGNPEPKSSSNGVKEESQSVPTTSDEQNNQQTTNEEEVKESTGTADDEPDGQQQCQPSDQTGDVLTLETQQHKLAGQGVSNESEENESEELDDIELIFTTEETCPEVGIQEDLVPITDNDNWQEQPTKNVVSIIFTITKRGYMLHPFSNSQWPFCIQSNQHKSVLKIGQAKSADSEPSNSICNGSSAAATSVHHPPTTAEKSSSMDEAANSSQSSSIDREESVDRFDESSSSKLNKMWSQCSVLVETDISKCGVLEEVDLQMKNAARRNTLAAPPTAYRSV